MTTPEPIKDFEHAELKNTKRYYCSNCEEEIITWKTNCPYCKNNLEFEKKEESA